MVTVVFGRVGCGKSTVSEKLCGDGAVWLETDRMLLTVFDSCLGEKHKAVERRCLLYLCGLAADLQQKGVNCILDSGLYTAQLRAEVKEFFARRQTAVKFIYVTAPENVRAERIRKRNEMLRGSSCRTFTPTPELVARLDSEFEPPQPDEYDETIDNI